MGIATKRLTTLPAIAVLVAAAACGGGSSTDFGSGLDAGTASNGDDGGASSGSTSGGDGQASFTGSGSAGADASTAACTPGAKEVCCNVGIRTCAGGGEVPIPTWGACLDTAGVSVTCKPTPCVQGGEVSNGCDAGMEAGPPAPPPPVCTDMQVSTEPEILVGYSPAMGQTVGPTGQIKVWVNDENAPFIAPGEQVDNTTGAIQTPGTRTAMAADGLLDEPALYIAPQTPTNGGTPHFPQWIKGSYNNSPPTRGTFNGGAAIDPPPAGGRLAARYTGEFIWDVRALGLAPGSYTAVFSVHDGDRDRAIGCVTIVITSG
jgi:hypothetical protein